LCPINTLLHTRYTHFTSIISSRQFYRRVIEEEPPAPKPKEEETRKKETPEVSPIEEQLISIGIIQQGDEEAEDINIYEEEASSQTIVWSDNRVSIR
jgi:hypothetical protein